MDFYAYDKFGNQQVLKLDMNKKPIAEGGEGAIYKIENLPDFIAKIYHQDRLTEKLEKKIKLMLNDPPADEILDQIAWPRFILNDRNGSFVGFVMPMLETDCDLKKIYVYPPKAKINTQQKIIIAHNICSVLAAVHEKDYIFGDFNPLNIGVNTKNGHVAFFDTDSYHFKKDGVEYRCEVAADGYVAPELLAKLKAEKEDYRGGSWPTFTKETDDFALAIHIFKLLMNGFTPFNGIKETATASTSNPGFGNAAIERDNYCFKPGNKPQSMAVPEMSCLSPEIQSLFKQTFEGGVKDPKKRATARQWEAVLAQYLDEVDKCPKNDLHYFYQSGFNECPYCKADERYNLSLGTAVSSYSKSVSQPTPGGQMSFATPIQIPSNQGPVFPATNNWNSNNYSSNSFISKIKSIKPLWIALCIIAWTIFFPITLAVTVKRKKDCSIITAIIIFMVSSMLFAGVLELIGNTISKPFESHSSSSSETVAANYVNSLEDLSDENCNIIKDKAIEILQNDYSPITIKNIYLGTTKGDESSNGCLIAVTAYRLKPSETYNHITIYFTGASKDSNGLILPDSLVSERTFTTDSTNKELEEKEASYTFEFAKTYYGEYLKTSDEITSANIDYIKKAALKEIVSRDSSNSYSVDEVYFGKKKENVSIDKASDECITVLLKTTVHDFLKGSRPAYATLTYYDVVKSPKGDLNWAMEDIQYDYKDCAFYQNADTLLLDDIKTAYNLKKIS